MGLTTDRQYKSLKRKQIRQVIAAIEELQLGCCELPGYNYDHTDCLFRKMSDSAKELRERMKVKNWGN